MRTDILHSNKRNMYAFFICLAIAVFCIVFAVVYTNNQTEKDMSKVYDYNEIISNGTDKDGMYVSLTFVSQPYLYASKETDSGKENCYLVYDENQTFYILRLSDSTYDSIVKIYIKDKDNFKYTINGFLKNTPNDLKKITIEEFNKLFDEEIVNESNFSRYFGNTYLDQTYSPTHAPTVILMFVGFISGITSIVFIVIYFTSKKYLKGLNIPALEAELLSSDTIEFPKFKLYLTANYIISKNTGALKILEYKEIVWMYIQKRYYNGIPVGAFLTVANKNKSHQIVLAKNENDLADIMQVIFSKNDSILLGYTPENISAYKQIKKQK